MCSLNYSAVLGQAGPRQSHMLWHTKPPTLADTHTHNSPYISSICSYVFLLTYSINIIQPRQSLCWLQTHAGMHAYISSVYPSYSFHIIHPNTQYRKIRHTHAHTLCSAGHSPVSKVSEAVSSWADPCYCAHLCERHTNTVSTCVQWL